LLIGNLEYDRKYVPDNGQIGSNKREKHTQKLDTKPKTSANLLHSPLLFVWSEAEPQPQNGVADSQSLQRAAAAYDATVLFLAALCQRPAL